MRRTVLAMMMVACAAPGFATSEAPVSEFLNDPSNRTPLLTSPATIAANGVLDQFFAQMRLAFNPQTSITPFRASSQSLSVRTAGVSSIGAISPADARADARDVEREAKELHASVEIGSSLDSPWEAWENREEAVTDEYRDDDR